MTTWQVALEVIDVMVSELQSREGRQSAEVWRHWRVCRIPVCITVVGWYSGIKHQLPAARERQRRVAADKSCCCQCRLK